VLDRTLQSGSRDCGTPPTESPRGSGFTPRSTKPEAFGIPLIALLISFFAGVSLHAETGPPLLSIDFEGPLPASRDKTIKTLDIELGAPFDPEEAQSASDRLMEEWRDLYYPLASVRWRALPVAGADGLEAVFISEPGPKGKLTAVRFTGNHAIDSEALRSVLNVRPRKSWWDHFTGKDILLVEELAADQEAILMLYQDRGYMDAVVGSPDLVQIEGREEFELVWPIEMEGEPYEITGIYLTVDGTPRNQPWGFPIGLASGETVSPARIAETVEDLRTFFLERGYAFVEVDFEPEWDECTHGVDLFFSVQTGGQSKLRKIVIEGDEITRESIILREIPVQPGSVFNLGALQVAQSNLEATGLFSEVDFEYGGVPGEPEYDLLVDVKERRTGRVEAGVSYDTGMGAAVIGRISDQNFALAPPWRGAALQPSLTAMVGSEILRLEADLRNPRIGRSYWGLSSRIFYEDNQYLSDFYDQRGGGASLTFNRPLNERNLIALGVAFNHFSVYDVSPLLAADLSDSDTDLDMIAPLVSWVYDSTDRDFRPTSGLRLVNTLQWGVPINDAFTNALVYEGRGMFFLNPWGDHIIQVRAGFETVDPIDEDNAPLPLRVWIGGPETLRGFLYHSVSPIENGVAIGGQSAWWTGFEYLVPVFPRLDVSIYYELGGVSADSWSFAGEGPVSDWGIGFQVRAENFPIRLDIAWPIEVLSGDPQNRRGDTVISFSAGYLF